MTRLTVRACREFAQAYLQTMDPARAAAAAGLPGESARLLQCPEAQRQIQALREAQHRLVRPEDVVRQLVYLAFGPANDCVRLVLDPDADPDALDLTPLAELKRSEKGAVEVKLVDRLAVLQQLQGLLGSANDAAQAFFQALEEGAEP